MSIDHPSAPSSPQTVANAPAADPATAAGATSYLSLALMPKADDTTVKVYDPFAMDTLFGDRKTIQVVSIRCGGATVQFSSPADALAWLAHCTAGIVADLEQRKEVAA